jgi:hypothetical protein
MAAAISMAYEKRNGGISGGGNMARNENGSESISGISIGGVVAKSNMWRNGEKRHEWRNIINNNHQYV